MAADAECLSCVHGFAHVHFHVMPRQPDLDPGLRGPRVFGLLGGDPYSHGSRRQFAAAVAVVGVVVLNGLAWNRLAPSLPGEGPAGRAFAVRGHLVKVLPPGGKPPPGGKLLPGAGPPPAGAPGIGTRPNNGSGIPGLLVGDLLAPAGHHRYLLTVFRAAGMYQQRAGRLCTSRGNARISVR